MKEEMREKRKRRKEEMQEKRAVGRKMQKKRSA